MLQNNSFIVSLFFISISLSAQINGIVKDSISGKPIPFVNIWVENENIGSTSEENGTFSINTTEKSKNLIFSTLGFEKKISKATNNIEVYLKPIAYQLEEVVILKRRETKEIEIGRTNNETYQAFDNGPKIDTKFFPYFPSYKKTKYLKQVKIYTDNRVENATAKIHFYAFDSNGFPGKELLNKDFIITVKKGTRINTFDVKEFNLQMPQNGIFVGFEKLLIENNKIEKNLIDLNTNKTQLIKTYYPFVLYNFVEREFSFTFSGGKWIKQSKLKKEDLSQKIMIYEPAINLILTN